MTFSQSEIKDPNMSQEAIDDLYANLGFDIPELFPDQDFLNFGLWPAFNSGKQVTFDDRYRASKNLYIETANNLLIDHKDTVLDLGSGRGGGTILLAELFGAHKCFGIDSSMAQVKRAQETVLRLPSLLKEKITFLHASVNNLPFDDKCFEKIISVESAQHFPPTDAYLRESFRVLKPAGRLVIATFMMPNEAALDPLKTLCPTFAMGIDNAMAFLRVIEDAANVGFRILETKSIGGRVFPGFDQWMAHVPLKHQWNRQWLTAFEKNLIDYYVITLQKPSA